MANLEIISAAANMRGYLVQQYYNRGRAFGYEFAALYIEEIAHGVIQVQGRDAAAKILMNVTDAVLAGIPLCEMDFEPGCILVQQTAAPEPPRRSTYYTAASLILLGMFLAVPVGHAIHWLTGW